MRRFCILLTISLLLSSCDILEKKPLTSITNENYFKNEQDANTALTGAYNGLQTLYNTRVNGLGEMPSDNVTSANVDVTFLDNITWNSSSGRPNSVFSRAYTAIKGANAVLANVPDIDFGDNSSRKSEILGEAHFIRALSYFNLAKFFGGVPLVLKPVGSDGAIPTQIARSPVDSVYLQVIKDFDAAEQMAPKAPSDPATARGRATSGAASALKSRVYLFMGEYGKVTTEAQKVFDNPLYSSGLLSDFDDLWPANYNQESIFEVGFSPPPGGGTSLNGLYLPSPPASYTFPKYNIPRDEFINSYVDTTNDLRYAYNGSSNVSFTNLKNQEKDANNGYFVWKWRSAGNGFSAEDNYPVIRLAEVKLNYAEASNEANGPNSKAFKQLNDVRTRAGLPGVSSTDFPTKQLLRDQIDRQRRLELAFEGKRWNDLVRYARQELATGNEDLHKVTALDIIEDKLGTRDENYLLYAIPQAEIDENKLADQNPGF